MYLGFSQIDQADSQRSPGIYVIENQINVRVPVYQHNNVDMGQMEFSRGVEASFSKTTGNKTLEFGKFHPPMT
jgi:hypothetical protein